jgi:thioredoxin reductase
MASDPRYDALIVGGGIAGLSAALILGRCRRRTLVCDHGRPRNSVSSALHAFLSRDGIHPLELRRIGREQLEAYPCVDFREAEVVDACERAPGHYEIVLSDGERIGGRRILIATGLKDNLPPIEGIRDFYGKSVHHCPICDASPTEPENPPSFSPSTF